MSRRGRAMPVDQYMRNASPVLVALKLKYGWGENGDHDAHRDGTRLRSRWAQPVLTTHNPARWATHESPSERLRALVESRKARYVSTQARREDCAPRGLETTEMPKARVRAPVGPTAAEIAKLRRRLNIKREWPEIEDILAVRLNGRPTYAATIETLRRRAKHRLGLIRDGKWTLL